MLGKFICKFLRCLNVDDILVKSWGLILYLAEDKRTEYFKLAQMGFMETMTDLKRAFETR